MLDVKEAVRIAKDYVTNVYAENENISNLGLEETEYEHLGGFWKITVGFSRPFISPKTPHELLKSLGAGQPLKRSYKVITVSDDGTVRSMKNRSPMEADA